MCEPGSTNPFVFNNCITVKAAAFHSGYNVQYLRRLLRDGRLCAGGAVRDVLTEDNLAAVYGARLVIADVAGIPVILAHSPLT